MALESDIGTDEFMLDLDDMDAFINEKSRHKKGNMFGRNHTREYQTLLT